VVNLTTRQKPPNATGARAPWSTAARISEASVRRIWHPHGLKPHRVESFKISNDPEFAAKLEDIVGLYLNPPEHALVLCVDENSQIQALDRTQPGLTLKRGRSQTLTHTTNAMAPPPCLLRSMRPMARSSGFVRNGIATRSGSGFCVCSIKPCRCISTCA
jgi:hypothetical protein